MRRCGDVIIRQKAYGAVRLRQHADGTKTRQLYYLVYSEHSLTPQFGHLVGFNFLIAAALVRELVRPVDESEGDARDRGLKDGIYRCTLFATRGYADMRTRQRKVDRNWRSTSWRKRPEMGLGCGSPAGPAADPAHRLEAPPRREACGPPRIRPGDRCRRAPPGRS